MSNAIMSIMKICLSIVFPLISFPYVSRILQVENMGKIAYGNSIISYFSLLAEMGIVTYAVREGAMRRNNREKFEKFGSEMVSINLLTTILSYIVLAVLLLFVPKFESYRLLLVIQSIVLIFNVFGMDWINTVYEEYAYILLRSFIIQVISIILIFSLVKDINDYYLYVLIQSGTGILVSIFNYFHIKKMCKLKLTFNKKMFVHLKSMFVFFVNTITISIYISSDTTMMGWMIGDYYTGLYSTAVRVYSILKTILNAIYTVAIPRLAEYISMGDIDSYKKTLTDIVNSLVIFMIPIVFGTIILSDDIILVLSGKSYLEATRTMQILSVSLLFAVTSGIMVTCVNATLKREKISMKGSIWGAAVNVLLNIFMIPLFKHNGAAVTTLIAEFIVAFYCIHNFKNINDYIEIRSILKQLRQSIIGCLIFLIPSIAVKFFISSTLLESIIIVFISVTIYACYLRSVKNEYFLSILNVIKVKLLRN